MDTLPGDPTDFFQVLEKLGEGSYGEVYSALDTRTGKMVAIKAIPLEADLSDIQKEIAILRKCRSPYVVSYYGSYGEKSRSRWVSSVLARPSSLPPSLSYGTEKDGDLWIVMEYCSAGSVSDLMSICDSETIVERRAGGDDS